jgi:hypothetical protein
LFFRLGIVLVIDWHGLLVYNAEQRRRPNLRSRWSSDSVVHFSVVVSFGRPLVESGISSLVFYRYLPYATTVVGHQEKLSRRIMDKDQERNQLIEEIRRISKEIGSEHVPRHEFRRRSGLSERQIQLLFGSYNALAEAAGLETRSFPEAETPQYTDDDLLREVVRVLRLPGSKMTRIFFERHASVSSSVCERRFGGWIGTLREASRRLDHESDRELLARVREYTDTKVKSLRTTVSPENAERSEQVDGESQEPKPLPPQIHEQVYREETSNLFGDFINFRGLQHAPVNEQGVVFLFGMVCRELGYVVESVRAGFPDCEAKRKVGDSPTRWQRVRIEFEYLSRNFKSHGHDPDKCDLIVCWRDNWLECPIEILELSSTMRRLSSEL